MMFLFFKKPQKKSPIILIFLIQDNSLLDSMLALLHRVETVDDENMWMASIATAEEFLQWFSNGRRKKNDSSWEGQSKLYNQDDGSTASEENFAHHSKRNDQELLRDICEEKEEAQPQQYLSSNNEQKPSPHSSNSEKMGVQTHIRSQLSFNSSPRSENRNSDAVVDENVHEIVHSNESMPSVQHFTPVGASMTSDEISSQMVERSISHVTPTYDDGQTRKELATIDFKQKIKHHIPQQVSFFESKDWKLPGVENVRALVSRQRMRVLHAIITSLLLLFQSLWQPPLLSSSFKPELQFYCHLS